MANSTRSVQAALDIDIKEIEDFDDMYAVMSYYKQFFAQMENNLRTASNKFNQMHQYMLTVLKDDRSKSIIIDEIDLLKSFNKLIEISGEVGSPINKEAYKEAFEFFVSDLLKSEQGIAKTQQFIGFTVIATRLDNTAEQVKRAKLAHMENFIDMLVRQKNGKSYIDLTVHGLADKIQDGQI